MLRIGKLFANRWNGPFKVKKQLDKGSYVLEEMDGTELKGNYAASHIKRAGLDETSPAECGGRGRQCAGPFSSFFPTSKASRKKSRTLHPLIH
jgi:hypothetical protein